MYACAPERVVAQVFLPFPHGLGVEVGAGHNQLLWHARAVPGLSQEIDASREEFSVTAIFRLHYEFYPLDGVQILPFVGYNKFGGASATMASGYRDKYWIQAVEIGSFATYAFNDVRVGIGYKYNRHVSMTVRYYGSLYETGTRSWQEEVEKIFLKKYSSCITPRGSKALSHWRLSAEAWFGISSLQQDYLDDVLAIQENHYRVILAFTL